MISGDTVVKQEVRAEGIVDVTTSRRCDKCHATFANDYAVGKHGQFCMGATSAAVLNSILLPSVREPQHRAAETASEQA